MTGLAIMHATIVAAVSSAVAYALARRHFSGLRLVVAYIAGLVVGTIMSFLLAFFFYPSVGLIADGEEFIFQTYALFRMAILVSAVATAAVLLAAWTKSRSTRS